MLFLQSDGKSFLHGKIAKRLPEFWRKTGVRSDLHVTATNIRKWIVTVCHEKKSEGVDVDEDTLRRAMCHSDKAAKSSYLREDLTKVAACAMNIIAMCTNRERQAKANTSNISKVDTTKPSPSTSEDIPVAMSAGIQDTSLSNDNSTPDARKPVESTSEDIPVLHPSAMQYTPIPKNRPLTVKEKDIVKLVF